MMKVRDSVRAAADEAQFAKVLSAMKDSAEAKLNTADIPSAVKLARSSFGLTDASGEQRWLAQLRIQGYSLKEAAHVQAIQVKQARKLLDGLRQLWAVYL